ncbi:hypothetical protein MMC27_004386 [Xylographa pallens]|nr:hypothetical protein [Xylographa pallens]
MSSLEAANLFAVKGIVAVITGGGTGIGLMMAKALALNGAHKVYIIGRRKETLEAAAKESPHGNIVPLVGDVTSKDAISSIAEQIKNEVGYINVLIANSGIGGPQTRAATTAKSIEEYQYVLWGPSFEEYTQTFAVNASGVYFSIVAFLGLLDAGNQKGNVEQRSQVIATSSIAGFNRQTPGGYAYGQSKAATTLMMKQLATSLVPYRIRANVICPGRAIIADLYATVYPSEMAAPIIGTGVFPKEKIPEERVGTPEDMAGCILYLTSRAGAYCNGNVIVSDGGRLSVMTSTY